jgi:hypothetical protein
VCGWSASWDAALRRAIERCPSRRFTTWWAAQGDLGNEASSLVAQRRARIVPIASADTFFQRLAERLTALEHIATPHPASPAISVAMVKRYLADPVHRIRLHDLVMEEVTRTVDLATSGAAVTPEAAGPTYESARETIRTRVSALEAASESLIAMLAVGCYWGGAEQVPLWTKVIEQLAAGAATSGATIWYQQLHRYPALLALYAAAIGSIGAGKEEIAIRLLLESKVTTIHGVVPAVAVINTDKVMETNAMEQLPGLEHRKTPASDHLLEYLTPVFKPLLPDQHRFERVFDRFEYLLALTFLGQKSGEAVTGYAPVGRFSWRQRNSSTLAKDIEAEAKKEGAEWLLLRLGLFGGSLDEFLRLKAGFDQFSHRLGI